MARLVWGAVEDRRYEGGLDRGVLYIENFDGVPWNGLVSVEENPSGRSTKTFYFDGFHYLTSVSTATFAARLNAFSSPEEFDACDGTVSIANGMYATEQPRKPFGLSYRTKVADANGNTLGYKVHLVYNAYASISGQTIQTLTDDGEASPLTWDITAAPVPMAGIKPTAHFVIDSTVVYPEIMQGLEEILYGSDEQAARLPTPEELASFIKTVAYLLIDDNGDGSFTATGPDDVVYANGGDLWTITYPSVIPLGNNTYEISTL